MDREEQVSGSEQAELDPDAAITMAGFPSCDETIERLYYYLDGELTEQRREEIGRHLDLCGPCGSAVEFEAELRKVVANRCRERVPDSLIDRVAAALDAEQLRARAGGLESAGPADPR